MMSGIQGKNTRPELLLRHQLHRMGFRYRLYAKNLPAKPDLVFPKYKAVIFIHGCFWHRHPGCKYTTNPATRPEFWEAKFQDTIERDKIAFDNLSRQGWRVGVVWECALRRGQETEVAEIMGDWLMNGNQYMEVPEPAETKQRRLSPPS
jgi:DNA mismatch endonuclease (patch repair protein)